MELKKESIQMLRTKSKAMSQVTFDEDANVPDVKPDVGRVIQSKGDVSMEEVRLNDGHAFLRGNLETDILYVGEEDRKIYSLAVRLPFEERMNLDGIVNGDKMCLKWEIEDISIHVIHSRKLNVKAVVTFYASVDERTGIQLPVEAEKEGFSVRKKDLRLMSLEVHKKDTMRIKDEIVLNSNRPNISELLWYVTEIRGLELRPGNQEIRARGEIFVFALYEGDDGENPVQWLEYSLPFSRELECTESRETMIPNIQTAVVHRSIEVKPDEDGEERILTVDVVLEMDIRLYEERSCRIVTDVYTPSRECNCVGKEEILESLLIHNESRCRVTDRVEVKQTQGKVLQLCYSQGKIKIDQTRMVEKGILAEGVVCLKILYLVEDDDMPFYSMEAMIPFSHVVEAAGMDEHSVYFLDTRLEQLSATMAESNTIEIRAVAGIGVLVVQRMKEKIIERIEEYPLDMKKIQMMPGITVYIVKPQDTLWDIAKQFYSTVEDICALNHLPGEEIHQGQPLLLVKRV